MKLSGYEEETQEMFKEVFELCETSKIETLNYEEIMNLKSAIKRDIEAINFVKKMGFLMITTLLSDKNGGVNKS
jgi:hypothetical protein